MNTYQNLGMKTRGEATLRRTYTRPLNDEGTETENWNQVISRVKEHQLWLWERAKGSKLNQTELSELDRLEELMLEKKVLTSGRTLWLGGTDIAKKRESSQFNCSFTNVENLYDVVDVLWLLLQGCGVGFKPVVGTLNGFAHPIPEIEVIRSSRKRSGGREGNKETFRKGVWTVIVGDSAEAWAKSIGKILAFKKPAKKLVLDFSQIRPAGTRLKGYGWISSGDEAIAKAYTAIAGIMNKRAGQLLTKMDISDLINWLGTVLSSRRSAEICLFEHDKPEWQEFAVSKKNYWETGNEQRSQANNSLLFYSKPPREKLVDIFNLMEESGGSEPGFINGETALKRAPWFAGVNPCAEILLGNKSFCNLTEVDIGAFKGDTTGLHEALHMASRANYRQTCVNLKDGILQEAWHLNNEFLRLCGVGITGIARREDLQAYDYRQMERVATSSAYSMADQLGLQRPKNVTTVKPSGTLSKVMGTSEGVHKPMSKYIFNNINFGKNDPLVPKLIAAGYKTMDNPLEPDNIIVTFPISWENMNFDKITREDGTVVEVNLESAIDQLERYKLIQNNWNHHNTSITISYDLDEVPGIIDWLLDNWESYVGVSFIYRADPSKTAKDLGYAYLPQESVTKENYDSYTQTLLPVDFSGTDVEMDMESQECAGGHCPVV